MAAWQVRINSNNLISICETEIVHISYTPQYSKSRSIRHICSSQNMAMDQFPIPKQRKIL
jgi:hypothetical protein